jgi:hypothetical protein
MSTTVPLNQDIETGDTEALEAAGVNLPPEPELKGALKPVAETTWKERIAGGVAVCAVGTSLAAIIVEQSAVVIVAGILSCVMGPYAYLQQTKLTDIATLKETAAAVQVEVDRLKLENDRLGKNIDELGNVIDDLQDVEEALEVISKMQGQSVGELEKQVQENKEILSKMKQGTKGRVIQNLISIIYRGDENADDMICEDEATSVIQGLSKIGGLMIHEDRLREAITGKSIEAVIDVVKNLLSDDVPEDEKIFEIKEE